MARSITITGALGSGKSTIAKLLAQKLGYTHYSTGDAQRQIAAKYNMTTLELNQLADTDPSIDQQIDSVFHQLEDSEQLYAIDSRMAWFFMPKSFKVKLTVEPKAAALRILNDTTRSGEKKYQTIDDALEATMNRRTSEIERFKRTYGVDIEDPNNYDITIDTTDLTPEQVCAVILKEYANQ